MSNVRPLMLGAVKSLLAGFRASAELGRASRLERQRKLPEAVAAARLGLERLRQPFVKRSRPIEGSSLASLTVLVERIATLTGAEGAQVSDLRDSLSLLKSFRTAGSASYTGLQAWIPYLEARLARHSANEGTFSGTGGSQHE
jgi:hypothetical protein